MGKITAPLSLIILIGLTSCNSSRSDSTLSGNGVSGSFSRFEVEGNALYTFDEQFMTVIDISDPRSPSEVSQTRTMAPAESTRKRDSVLFVASSSGLEIFDISTPLVPQALYAISHISSCDPIALKDSMAYLTLRSDPDVARCRRGVDRLDILNIKDIQRPVLVNDLEMTRPMGIGVQDSLLWVCDDGLKVFSLKDPYQPQLKDHFQTIDAIDIVIRADLLIVSGKTRIYQYRYENGQLIQLSQL
ncbi:MAG: hypothetical protein LPK80_02380 [Bacteroidota bacterium]|nr:hypothetical protein [Bacteroidota bacterium]MDX5428368.1 hypothetical protein [Bacteroidota bacterium]MDX5506141.1 hypothetical protein [Bacteroidota bacterium]